MGYLVVRSEETKRIFLDEIAVLLIENPAVSMTGCLLQTLAEKKIKVIFCDNKRSPYGELIPYYGCHDASKKLKQQIEWSEENKAFCWAVIIAQKIRKQADHLLLRGKKKEAEILEEYITQIVPGDATNREGHAAKVYFNALFGKDFKRSDENHPINMALNYGYSILLSAFNRAVSCAGYTTQIGIHHDNIYNFYNLSSDLMEPYRILIDRIAVETEIQELDKDLRYEFVKVLNQEVKINNTRQTVLNSIDLYTRSIFQGLNTGEMDGIKFYSL